MINAYLKKKKGSSREIEIIQSSIDNDTPHPVMFCLVIPLKFFYNTILYDPRHICIKDHTLLFLQTQLTENHNTII